MFQNMFPAINPGKIKVNSVRRCVLLNYNQETKTIEFRHYTIKLNPIGLNRGVKKIVTSRVPNLGKCSDVAEYLQKGGAVSESEGEDDDAAHVTAPQGLAGRGVLGGATSSVRLVELGPRMSLKLVKIEEGLLDGEILHHEFVEKTDEEKKAIKEGREQRKREKEKRRKDQEKNVHKKKKERESNKSKSLEGMRKKEEKEKSWQGQKVKEYEEETGETVTARESSDDDDAAYYEAEVGHKPDKDLFKPGEKRSGGSRSADIGKRFSKKKIVGGKLSRAGKSYGDRADKDKFNHKDSDRKDKKKKKLKVFNKDGVGPNFKKSFGAGKGKLRGVQGGKIVKNKNRKGKR